MVFGGKIFRKYLGLDEVMRVGTPKWNYCPYKKTLVKINSPQAILQKMTIKMQ